MKWSTHIIFAVCLVLSVGVYLKYPYEKPVPVKTIAPAPKYDMEESAPTKSKARVYKYEHKAAPKRHTVYLKKREEGKSIYDHVCQGFELVANVIPVIVAIAWCVTTIRARRKKPA